jgi:carboxylesterase type B
MAIDTVVRTVQGRVRGAVENGVVVFRGIPYALPPVGSRRFRPPVRVPGWDGVREATRFGQLVLQPQDDPLVASGYPPGAQFGDDCLSLNVWTPATDPLVRLPVMVWVHGGGFRLGTGSEPMYDGATFARDGVVCVTLNYRLGAAGFLNVGDRAGTGCFGLLDQVAALEWVQENIAAFGGDPTRVTLAGQSAGGFSIGQLLAAPAAHGLFARAIVQSGGAHMHMHERGSAALGAAVLRRLGVAVGDDDAIAAIGSHDLLAAQIATESEYILLAREAGAPLDPVPMALLPFVPTYGADFQPEAATAAIAKGAARGVELLIGTNADEIAMFWPTPEAKEYALPGVQRAVDVAFADAGVSGAQILEAYRARRGGADLASAVVPCQTDLCFRIPSIRLAEAAAAHSRVHMYRFTWAPGALGSTHIMEMPFVFDSFAKVNAASAAGLGMTEAPHSLVDAIHGAWCSFIDRGVPRHASLPPWPRYDVDRRATMELNLASRVVDDPDRDERQLWETARY